MKKPNFTCLLFLLLVTSVASTAKPLDETKAEMQPEMLFRLGSTTKMFTAAALMTLSEQAKIKLNEPIGNRVFVPGKSGKVEYLFTELYAAKKVR